MTELDFANQRDYKCVFKFRKDFYSRLFNLAIYFTSAKNAKFSTNWVRKIK